MKTFAIITNKEKDVNMQITNKLTHMLEKKCRLLYGTGFNCEKEIIKNCDAVIVLGGDGTILAAARDAALYNKPILGINLGTLGFMAETEICDMQKNIQKLLCGDYTTEKRFMLRASVRRGDKIVFTLDALNDIVISRPAFKRMVNLDVYVDKFYLSSYYGDGLIIATPTGSTAYSMSAGGPIVEGSMDLSIITPICPHTLSSKPIIVPPDSKISIGLRNKTTTGTVLTADGQVGFELEKADIVSVERSPYRATLVKIGNNSFYDLVSKKLGGN